MSFYGGTATPSELSNRVMRSKHATTKAVDTLDKLGLARSNKTDLDSKEKGDRRLRKISITEKGLEILERTIPQRNENASLIMQCFDAREAKAFSTSLQTLVQHLEQLSLK
jgi:DNA-binding MarR family transcriptional regulator